jgi:hypothetical protein
LIIPVEEWLRGFRRVSTRKTYPNALIGRSGFFTFMKIPTEKYICKYSKKPDVVKQHIISWFSFMNGPDPEYPMKKSRIGGSGRYLYRIVLEEYLYDNGIRFEGRFWKNINNRQIGGRAPQAADEVPENPDAWAKVIHEIRHIKYKAFYLFVSLFCNAELKIWFN